MKKFVILSISVLLQSATTFGATFRYVNTITKDGELVWRSSKDKDNVIEMNSDTPKSLFIFGQNYRLDTPLSFVKTGPDSWEEVYLVSQFGRIPETFDNGLDPIFMAVNDRVVNRVTLYKSLSGGVTKIMVGSVSDKIHLFRPEEGQWVAVTHVPPVFINDVAIANVGQDGTVIDDYGSTIKPDDVDQLKMVVIFQPNAAHKDITMNVNIVNVSGASLVDKKSRQDHHITLPVEAVDSSTEALVYEIGVRSPKQLKNGAQLEVSVDGQKLYSMDMPLRTEAAPQRGEGAIMYRPIAIEEVGGPSADEFNVTHPIPPASPPIGPSLYGMDYSRPRPSTVFQVGGTTYRMTQWVEVEP